MAGCAAERTQIKAFADTLEKSVLSELIFRLTFGGLKNEILLLRDLSR